MNKRLFFLFIGLAFIGCKKKMVDEIEPCQVAEDLPAYSYFKKGTYWIYQDSITSKLDSVYVYFDTNYVYHNQGWGIIAEGDYPFYSMSSYSVVENASFLYIIDYGRYATNSEVGTLRKRIDPLSGIGSSYLMSNIFQNGIVIYYYGSLGEIAYKNYYERYKISNKNFDKVVEFSDSDNASENRSQTIFFISKNIGIIRKEIIDSNQIWNLIRYHIVQ